MISTHCVPCFCVFVYFSNQLLQLPFLISVVVCGEYKKKAAIETHSLNKDNFMNYIFFLISGAAEIKMEHFLDLPDELILKVLSYTETVDILRCGGVSKRIRTISNDNSLFQSVNLSGKIVKADFLETVLNKDCKSLNLSNSFIRGNLTLIKKSQLRKLDLSNCQEISNDV